jgi:mRNA-degrading endonuclease toxin of MazEF toxin-antitoxin module
MSEEYEKDFDGWNMVKKNVDRKNIGKNFYFYAREIWWGSLGLNIGAESDGKNDLFERPLLILKVFNKEMLWCLPITSTIKDLPFYYKIKFNNESRSVLVTQIKTISSKRLLRKVEKMNDKDFNEIVNRVISFLKSETPTNCGGISEPKGDNI